ncbi:DUF998 domain-containing protein [Dactylosporangium sp. AC04546]|uniref:DUF998 domain-containing protein n=1 Tax=Dactylosporangium sp. AC04546 TaxID=2862460 RepID=UPI001EDFCCD3|nr:DUF998 domain-containing protein [Dactylosporangium sp. AC04546]WVK80045.1 DUF998 domain-containing protein [Dactylosporangium sp. AC04546]
MTTTTHTAPRTRALTRSVTPAVAAAPLFVAAALAQAATRDGYDLTRHPVSMLALGDLGWIQTTVFVATALLTLAAVPAVRRLASGWTPRLLTLIGAGLLVAATFEMDPSDGFPLGTPAGPPSSLSWHFVLHNVGGSLSFLSMIALCFVLSRRLPGTWRWTGRTAGALFTAGLAWAMTGGTAGSLTLFLGVAVAWLWIAAALHRLQSRPV